MNDKLPEASLQALQTAFKDFQNAQSVLLSLKNSGASAAELQSALIQAGYAGLTVKAFLAAETIEDMLDCMKPHFLPEDN
jgi:hypothetical protein